MYSTTYQAHSVILLSSRLLVNDRLRDGNFAVLSAYHWQEGSMFPCLTQVRPRGSWVASVITVVFSQWELTWRDFVRTAIMLIFFLQVSLELTLRALTAMDQEALEWVTGIGMESLKDAWLEIPQIPQICKLAQLFTQIMGVSLWLVTSTLTKFLQVSKLELAVNLSVTAEGLEFLLRGMGTYTKGRH